jgi:DNA helicase II / ATP-dependent DNA helicase PcrA
MISLDEKQTLILHSNKNEPFNKCIFACPGAGKTRLLIAELVYLLNDGVDPREIVSISFTKKSAHQMKERLKEYNDNTIPYGIKIGTFHNVALSYIREYEYKNLSKYTIIDDHDYQTIITKLINKQLEVFDSKFPKLEKNDYKYFKRTIKNNILNIVYSKGNDYNLKISDKIKSITDNNKIYYKKNGIDLVTYKYFLSELYKSINNYKILNKNLSFDDIIHHFIELLDTEKGKELCDSISYLFVDEYQDVNNSQGILLGKMYENNPKIIFTVVGDDAQSIYKFRGSEPKYIREFEEKFIPCKKFILENNYRSTGEIINLCNSVINNNNDNIRKNMQTIRHQGIKPVLSQFDSDTLEAIYVVDTINNLIDGGYQYNDIAILSRTNRYTSAMELLFVKKQIPYHNLSGLSLFETKHVKDFMAFINIMINPDSEIDFIRILMMIDKIGTKTCNSIIDCAKDKFQNYLDYLVNMDGDDKHFSKLEFINNIFGKLVSDDLKIKKNSRDIYNKINPYIKTYIQSNYDKINERTDDIEKLEYFFATYEDISTMVIDLHLSIGESSVNEDIQVKDNKILISTIHQSKGLEFKNIFVIGVQKCPLLTNIHNDDDIFEERRTFFVAISRAIDNLFISLSKEEGFMHSDEQFNTTYGSIFVNEILKYNNDLVENINYVIPKSLDVGNLSDIIKNKMLINGPSYVHKQMNNLEYEIGYLKNTYKIDNKYYPKLVGMMFDLIITRIFIEKFKNYKFNQHILYELKEIDSCQPLVEIFTDYKIPMEQDKVFDTILKLSVFCNYNVDYLKNNEHFLNNIVQKFKGYFNNYYFKEYLINFKDELLELIDEIDESDRIDTCMLHKYVNHDKVKGQIDLIINKVLIEIKYSQYPMFNAMYISQILSYNNMTYENDMEIETNLLLNPCTGEYIILHNNDNNLSISKNIFTKFIKG